MEDSPQGGVPPVDAHAGNPLLSIALSLVSTEAGGFQVRQQRRAASHAHRPHNWFPLMLRRNIELFMCD